MLTIIRIAGADIVRMPVRADDRTDAGDERHPTALVALVIARDLVNRVDVPNRATNFPGAHETRLGSARPCAEKGDAAGNLGD